MQTVSIARVGFSGSLLSLQALLPSSARHVTVCLHNCCMPSQCVYACVRSRVRVSIAWFTYSTVSMAPSGPGRYMQHGDGPITYELCICIH